MSRRTEASDRFTERRRQEDEAPRLRDVIPDLVACKLELAERRSTVTTADVSHTRHIVVERASTMFVIPCSDSSCKDGGYDIGSTLVRGLREHRNPITGEDTCHGSIGAAHCGRVLTFTAIPQYAAPAAT